MERNRVPRRTLAAITVVIALSCAPTASADPTSPLCKDGSWRKAHPLICDTGGGGGPGSFPGAGGGGGSGGLLGVIGDVVGGLTGGLL